jgi:hypothetical protein
MEAQQVYIPFINGHQHGLSVYNCHTILTLTSTKQEPCLVRSFFLLSLNLLMCFEWINWAPWRALLTWEYIRQHIISPMHVVYSHTHGNSVPFVARLSGHINNSAPKQSFFLSFVFLFWPAKSSTNDKYVEGIFCFILPFFWVGKIVKLFLN